MNFLFGLRLSSDFLRGSNIYKLPEITLYTQIRYPSIALVRQGTSLLVVKRNNSYRKGIKMRWSHWL